MTIAKRVIGALDVVSSIAIVIASAVVVWSFLSRGATTAAPAPPSQVAEVSGLRIDVEEIRNTSGFGTVAMVEFFDFECPICARHAIESWPEIKRELIDSGKLKYVAMHNPLEAIHPLALQAGEAAECAARQGKFWEFHERVFASPGALARADLVSHAAVLGLDDSGFATCLDSRETVDKVRGDQAVARRLDVSSTPTFFIGTVTADGSVELATRVRGIVPTAVLFDLVTRAGKMDGPGSAE